MIRKGNMEKLNAIMEEIRGIVLGLRGTFYEDFNRRIKSGEKYLIENFGKSCQMITDSIYNLWQDIKINKSASMENTIEMIKIQTIGILKLIESRLRPKNYIKYEKNFQMPNHKKKY
jgi:hypothetical protein